MDISSLLGAVMSDDSVGGMSRNAEVSTDETRSVLSAALPVLLGGALGQANDSSTAAGFLGALTQHSAADTSNLQSFMSDVDTEDGEKIVNHLFGKDTNEIVNQIAKDSGVKAKDVKKVLSSAAPLLMSLLGKETAQQQQQNSSLGFADIMGAMLGGGQQQQQQSASTNLLGGLLGSMLGGGAQQQASAQQQNNPTASLLSGLMGLLK